MEIRARSGNLSIFCLINGDTYDGNVAYANKDTLGGSGIYSALDLYRSAELHILGLDAELRRLVLGRT